ncbi:MAG: hypothetical protein IT185_11485 [Acidobacteria bacterium]|nr:hypothetical protein [Acidobacteriota bacterium]
MLRDVVSRFCVAAGVLALAACSELGPTSPQGNVTGGTPVVETFTGVLPLNGVKFYSFAVETSGVTDLTLVDAREKGVVTEALITIGLGSPRGTSCLATNVLSVASSGTPQLSGVTNKGIHCAVIYDPGNLTSEATFILNIARPR